LGSLSQLPSYFSSCGGSVQQPTRLGIQGDAFTSGGNPNDVQMEKKKGHFTHGKLGFTMIYPWKRGIYHDLPMEKWDLPWFTPGKVGFTMIYPWKSGIYHDLPMEKWDLP